MKTYGNPTVRTTGEPSDVHASGKLKREGLDATMRSPPNSPREPRAWVVAVEEDQNFAASSETAHAWRK